MTQKKYIVYFLVKIMQKTSDRRTQLRVPVQIPVSLRCREEPDARTAILEDLSWGGALCRIAARTTVSSHARFRAPDSDGPMLG